MSAERLCALLEEEKRAAIAADLDELERLAIAKRALMGTLEGLPRELLATIARQAAENRALLERLVELHRAFVAPRPPPPTYGAKGRINAGASSIAAESQKRGAL